MQHRHDEPTVQADGLVTTRTNDWHIDHGDRRDFLHQWTAVLDPAELSSGLQIGDVTAMTLRGTPELLGHLPPPHNLVQPDVQTAIAVEIDATDGWPGTALRNVIIAVDQLLDPPTS